MLKIRLASVGYSPVVFSDPLEGIMHVKKEPTDLVLLDINMPGMNGLEMCKRLQESDNTKDIPVIFLTARIESQDIVKGFEVGGVDYVTKPVNAQVLLARVRTHVSLKRTRDEQKVLIKKLQNSLAEIKTLSGLVPMCAHCKKIRDDEGYWEKVEVYIEEHSEAQFSHGICPECKDELYPELED
ncbi:response regulator [candidate division KSB1 bacterium]|nr:response regulator [candidate division KSB1 bacterium]